MLTVLSPHVIDLDSLPDVSEDSAVSDRGISYEFYSEQEVLSVFDDEVGYSFYRCDEDGWNFMLEEIEADNEAYAEESYDFDPVHVSPHDVL